MADQRGKELIEKVKDQVGQSQLLPESSGLDLDGRDAPLSTCTGRSSS